MPAASTKRKAGGSEMSGTRSKKAKKTPDFSDARRLAHALVEDDEDAATELSPSDVRNIASYALWLEEEVSAMRPKERTTEEIAVAAEKLRGACVSGIKKQMGWKPSCKTGDAKWVYDGVCADPVVFGSMLNLPSPPTWKAHKYTVDEFQEFMGRVTASVRYATLSLRGNVNIRYQAEEGTFKMSGTYGK